MALTKAIKNEKAAIPAMRFMIVCVNAAYYTPHTIEPRSEKCKKERRIT